MNSYFIIVNLVSGGYSKKVLAHTTQLLKKNSIEPNVYFTKSAGHATSITSEICKRDSAPIICVIGGDGTINEVINGITHNNVNIAVLPSGTTNVLAKELGILSYRDGIDKLLKRETKEVFICEIEAINESLKKRFVLMAGIGIDGEVVLNVKIGLKKIFGKYAYLFSAAKCLFSWDKNYLDVFYDGKSLKSHSVIVCNASLYAGNFKFARHTNVFKEGIQVVCIKESKFLSYIKVAKNLLLNKPIEIQPVLTSEVAILGKKAIQIDGDFFGFSPAKITISPLKIRFIV